jgi:hypothetical protein
MVLEQETEQAKGTWTDGEQTKAQIYVKGSVDPTAVTDWSAEACLTSAARTGPSVAWDLKCTNCATAARLVRNVASCSLLSGTKTFSVLVRPKYWRNSSTNPMVVLPARQSPSKHHKMKAQYNWFATRTGALSLPFSPFGKMQTTERKSVFRLRSQPILLVGAAMTGNPCIPESDPQTSFPAKLRLRQPMLSGLFLHVTSNVC